MAEVSGVDGVGFDDWGNDKNAERSSMWNGRMVMLAPSDKRMEIALASNGPDYSVRGDIEIKFGGSDGPDVSWGVTGSVSNDKGDSVSLGVRQDSEGPVVVKGSVEHSSENDDK